MAVFSTTWQARRLLAGSAYYEKFAPLIARTQKKAGISGRVSVEDVAGNVVALSVVRSDMPRGEKTRFAVAFDMQTGRYCLDRNFVARDGWKAFARREFQVIVP